MSSTEGADPAAGSGAGPTSHRQPWLHRVLRVSPPPPGTASPRRTAWRWATPLAVLLGGALCAVSAVDSDGTDLRPGRYTDLAQLVQSDASAYQRLRDQAGSLTQQVQRLTAGVDDKGVQRERRRAARLLGPAGLEPVSGPGVSLTLSDAPTDVLVAAAKADADGSGDINLQELNVHQQDIQAVVNALWAGGARAVTVQGQRIVSTTGIKCSGSVVRLQGVPYPAPYVVQAVGDPTSLQTALDGDPRVQAFVSDAEDPSVGIGWADETLDEVRAPAYDGLLDISNATPVS